MKEFFSRTRKILIVSGTFYPSHNPRAYRTTELARELARRGHEVTVYFPAEGRDYSTFERDNHMLIKDLGSISKITVQLKGKRFEFIIRRIIRRALQLVFEWPEIFLMFKVIQKLKTEGKSDLLISVAVPHPIHWGVARVRSRRRDITDCWIADCGDPFMGDRMDSFRKPFYFKYFEKSFCRRADFITIPIEAARSAYFREFHSKIRVIPQGFQLNELELAGYEKTHEYPVFAYAGGFIPGKRDPRDLLNALSASELKFKFIIYTDTDSLLLPFKPDLKEKLDIRGTIPRKELLQVLAQMDFLVNFDNNIVTQLPSKLIDYAITGRPVLNITSDLDENVLLEFLEGNYRHRMELEDPENYDIGNVADKFLQLGYLKRWQPKSNQMSVPILL